MKSDQQNYYYLTSLYSNQFEQSLKFSNIKNNCTCNFCTECVDLRRPTISLNPELQDIQNKFKESNNKSIFCQWVDFLDLLLLCSPKLPNISIIDTIVFKNGEPQYMIKHQKTLRVDRQGCRNYQKVIVQRKRELDIEFMKNQYIKSHPGFIFSSLDHIGQIIIRGFSTKLSQVIPEERRAAYVKLSTSPQPQLISERQVMSNIDMRTNKRYRLDQIEYLQIFPIPHSHEGQFRTVTVLFNREKQFLKPQFREAEFYFTLWQRHSDVLQKAQQEFISSLQNKQQYFVYLTYKLVLHIHFVGNIRIQSMAAQYYLDKFQNYYLKNVKNVCWKNMSKFTQSLNPKEKVMQIKKQNYIDLKQKMNVYFQTFKQKLQIFQETDRKIQQKNRQDREYSKNVIRQIKGEGLKWMLNDIQQ